MSARHNDPMPADLVDILERNRDDFEALRGCHIFVTGATGFVGSWLLESFLRAEDAFALGARMSVLTRGPEVFARAAPHLALHRAIEVLKGDVRDAGLVVGRFDAVIHAATPASAKLNTEEPLTMMDTVVSGTRRVLEVARRSGNIPFLFTSSGAVYGRQPPEMAVLREDYTGGPDPLDARNAYHESKRLAELQCAVYAAMNAVRPKIARLFAFVGPYLPIDRHFAVGNFVRDALAGRPIVIEGDGTPIRTYLYAADMTSWLWRILVLGRENRPYNLGSEAPRSIAETADIVAQSVTPAVTVERRAEPTAGQLPERYACVTLRARQELQLDEWTSFEDAVQRTIDWHRVRRAH